MKKVKPYLEFGYQKGDKKVPYDTKEYQDAYDFFMVSRYFKDIIAYRTGKVENIHHGEDVEDNIKKYTALSVCNDKPHQLVFYEIGSSLMGVIDSLEYLNKQYKELDVKEILFAGVDNSDMMNAGAEYLHEGYKLSIFKDIRILPCDLFFAKGISLLYALEDEKLLCDILKKSRISIFDYTFSKSPDSIKDSAVSGKPITFLSLEKCRKLLEAKGKKLVLQPSKRKFKIPDDRILYECVYGDVEVVDKYLFEIKKKLK